MNELYNNDVMTSKPALRLIVIESNLCHRIEINAEKSMLFIKFKYRSQH